MYSPIPKTIKVFCLLLTNILTIPQLSAADYCLPLLLDSLPAHNLLFAALDTFHQHKLTADLAEFELSTKGDWMNWLPSAGVGYAPVYDVTESSFTTKPRPSISWSLNQVFTAKKRKEALRAKKRSITENALLQNQTEKRKLRRLLVNYQLLQESLKEKKRLFAIEEELFEYYEKSYQNLDLLPSQFLLKKRDFLIKRYEIQISEAKINNAEAEILEAAYYSHTSNFYPQE